MAIIKNQFELCCSDCNILFDKVDASFERKERLINSSAGASSHCLEDRYFCPKCKRIVKTQDVPGTEWEKTWDPGMW